MSEPDNCPEVAESEQVEELLIEWGLSDFADAFKRNKITIDILPQLSDEDLKDLIPFIGSRILFQTKSKNFFERKRKKSSESDKESHPKIAKVSDTSLEVYDPTLILNSLLPIDQLLQKNEFGKSILINYSATKALTESIRNRLVDIIVKELSCVTKRANDVIFRGISQKICQTFPSESCKTYFISPIKKRNSTDNISHKSKGKLPIKWRNLLQLCKTEKEIEAKSSSQITNNDDAVEVDESITWLKQHEFADIEATAPHWLKTSAKRILTFHGSSVQLHDIFEEWKVLKHPEAYKLVEIDFKSLNLTKKICNEKSWNEFFNNILKVCKEHEKDETAKSLKQLLEKDDLKFDDRFIAGIELLCHLIPTKAVAKKKKKEVGPKKTWKVSIAESFQSIVEYTALVADIEDVRKRRIDLMYDYKKTVQPYIIVTGPSLRELNGFFVNVDSTIYKFSSFEEAFNTCFQSFHVFGTLYPFESEHIWLLIQKTVFDFNTKYDKTFSSIETIINGLKKCIQAADDVLENLPNDI